MAYESTTAAEMAAVKEEFDQLRERVDALESQRNDAIDALAAATGLTRRQVLGIIGGGAGMGALGVLASGQAQAAPSTSDADGDVGTPSNRADVFADGIDVADVVQPDADGGADLGTSSLDWGTVFAQSVDAGTVTAGKVVTGGFAADAQVTKTISSGAISVAADEFFIEVAGESGSADDLETINIAQARQVIVLKRKSSTITVKHNTASGNIFLGGSTDKTLDGTAERLVLMANDAGSVWSQLSYTAL